MIGITRHALLCILLALCAWTAHAAPLNPSQQALYDIFKEMVETNTVHPHGDNTELAQKVAARLKQAGFADGDMEIVAPAEKKGNLIVRLKGSGEKRPLLLLAHIDVVDARREDWSDGLDPFKLTEKKGYYYGRGVLDDKAMAAIFVANLIRLKAEGYKPKRDIIVALTADEEGGTHNGVAWLLKNRRELIDAEFALNEGGGGASREGKPFTQSVQVSEKSFLTFDFEATNSGGHSSVPRRDNAIYDLAGALDRLGKHDFPIRLSLVTRFFFGKLANIESGQLAKDIDDLVFNRASDDAIQRISDIPRYNAQLRTTCVATRLDAGHADNALPQRARATVNCRLLPGEQPDWVLAELQKIAGPKVTVTARSKIRASDPSDAESPMMKTIAQVSDQLWPGTPVIPIMSSGATDGSRLRNDGIPTYGVSGIFVEFGEVRIHGRDERIPVSSLYEGQTFLYRLTKALTE